jgi:hypothetical protein
VQKLERVVTMKRGMVVLLFLCVNISSSQDWHLNTEPVYFFTKAPNIALDYNLHPSVSLGFQYAALDWGKNGANLSGVQLFYSRTSRIAGSSEILKLYVGLLSPNTTLLKIEAKNDPLPLFEILYGYRWVFDGKYTVSVLGGTFFTAKNIYPSVSIPVGILL